MPEKYSMTIIDSCHGQLFMVSMYPFMPSKSPGNPQNFYLGVLGSGTGTPHLRMMKNLGHLTGNLLNPSSGFWNLIVNRCHPLPLPVFAHPNLLPHLHSSEEISHIHVPVGKWAIILYWSPKTVPQTKAKVS